MANGRLVHWNEAKGYGFIEAQPENIFIHATTLEAGGVSAPCRGDILEYEVGHGLDGRVRAVKARLAEPDEAEAA